MPTVAAPSTLSWQQEVGLGLLGLCGTGALWLTLSRHGVGLSPDSVSYLAVAQHILEGAGLTSYHGEPLVSQPPLYPFVLAGLMRLFNLDGVAAALFLNLMLYAAVIYLAGTASFSVTNSFGLSILTCLSVIASVPIFWVSVFAWSELLFIFLLMIHLNLINNFAINRKAKYLFLSAIITGCSCLTRYAGVTVIISSIILLLLLHIKNLKVGFARCCIFFLVSSLPIGLWIIRNYVVSGTFLGPRMASVLTPHQVLILFGDVLLDCFFYPSAKLSKVTWIIFSSLVLTAFFFFLGAYLYQSLQKKMFELTYTPIFIIVYSTFIILSAVCVLYDPIDHRLLSPIFIPLVIAVLCFFSQFLHFSVRKESPRHYRRFPVVFGLIIWFAYPAVATTTLAIEAHHNGQGYQAVHWRRSETIQYIRQHQAYFARQPIYTNDPEGLYFLVHIQARHLPFQVRSSWPESGQAYLVRFKHAYLGESLNRVEQLKSVAEITSLVKLADGEIYFVKRRNP